MIEAAIAGVPTPPALATVPRRKLTVPPTPRRLLRRPTVEARIRQGIEQRLLLITGPAGQGKTTTTAEALRRLPSVAWVSLDGSDRTPRRLQRHILASLALATGVELSAPPMATLDDTLAHACRQLEGIDGETVLVLDAAAAALEGAAARLLDRLLDWLPSSIRLVVLARRRPPIGIERRRARGEVAEIGPAELAFTDDEVTAYLNRTWKLALDDVTVRRVAEGLEGWPVALHAVASGLGDAPDVAGAARRITAEGSELAASFVREILEELPEADRRFLLDIAVLDDLDPNRCERLARQTAAAGRLDRLYGAGLLLPSAASSGVYRHRRLTRPLLLEELRTRHPARETALHVVAASVFATDGAWAEAIGHAIAAGDVGQAIDWLEAHLDELVRIEAGRWLSRALSRLPARSLSSRPRLLAASADLAMLAGDRDALERTLATLEGPSDAPAARLNALRRVRSYLSRLRGDGVEPLLVHRDRRALDPIIAHPLAVALAAEGRHEAATAAFRCALDDARGHREPLRELVILGDLAWQRALAGYLVDADLLVRRAAALASELGFAAPPAPALLATAQIALDRGRTEVARERAARARAATTGSCDLALRADVCLFDSRARWAHGDIDGAIGALEEVERELDDHTAGGGLVSRVAHARAGMCLALDDPHGTRACCPALTGTTDDLPPEARLIAAQLQLELGDSRRAHQVIETVRAAGIGPRLTVHALRIEATALGLLGDDLAAARIRRQADRSARVAGLLTPVVHRRLPRPSHDDPRRVGGRRDGDVGSAPGTPIEELTKREVDVLRRLPASTNVEIATALYVSVNTVKTHLKSIYRKLEVASRDAAVQEARMLGLV
jgi:LuxR family transcriptional regulator, maltose regulon positive regulatory protein